MDQQNLYPDSVELSLYYHDPRLEEDPGSPTEIADFNVLRLDYGRSIFKNTSFGEQSHQLLYYCATSRLR